MPIPSGNENLDELLHYGVKGMKWGVRHDPNGVSRRTNREARRDAQEFARAKMFYGEGAGNRRKLIKATVEAKSKKDPSYKKAFDQHLANQDMSKHASKARSERKRKNVKNSTAKTARGVRHILNGNSQFASLGAAMLVGGVVFAHKTGVDKAILKAGKVKISQLKDLKKSGNIKAGMSASEFLKNMGVS